MSCGAGEPTFRLLDANVGWDPDEVTGLTGLRDPDGLRLARLGDDPDAPTRREVLPWFPDPRLAPAPDGWYLAAPEALLRRGPDGCWRPVWPDCPPEPPVHAAIVAANGHWLAVAEPDGVRVWWREGDQLTAVIPVRDVRRLAVDRRGGVLLARRHGTDLWRYAADGTPRGIVRTGLPGRIEGLRTGPHGTVHVLTDDRGTLRLWTLDGRPARLGDLGPGLALTDVWDDGFCLRDRPDQPACYDWHGCPIDGPPAAAPSLRPSGELHTTAIDSGIPRCRWHRVTVDADVPDGCAVHVAVAVTEETGPDGAVIPPDETDWQVAPAGALDFLVVQPPGRHLLLRLALTGDGTATPVVRRIRLDLPRHTSADLLPAAYRADPAAEDFTERFLSLFDAELSAIDRVIDRYPALLDARGVPEEILPWLGALLGVAFEAGWPAGTRRTLITAAPSLYRRRGTPAGMRDLIRIVTGTEPVITDLAEERSWLSLGTARLGAGRLFGRSAARFRLGTSALGGAPLRSHGDPATDPLTAHAYRFRVSLPPAAEPVDVAALDRLVTANAPAHTAGTVHQGGLGWVVGVRSTVGVDTAFVPLAPAVLGTAGRVLAPARRGPWRGIPVGGPVGATTW